MEKYLYMSPLLETRKTSQIDHPTTSAKSGYTSESFSTQFARQKLLIYLSLLPRWRSKIFKQDRIKNRLQLTLRPGQKPEVFYKLC